MGKKVIGKQFVTEMCFGCGVHNPIGMKGQFYNLEEGKTVGVFQLGDEFQSFPARLHGGVTAAILDETLGRAILLHEPDCWAVTAELNVRYKKPVPLHVPLKIVAQVTENNRRLFRCSGELILPDGTVAATAFGVYVKQELERIVSLEEAGDRRIKIDQDMDREYIEY